MWLVVDNCQISIFETQNSLFASVVRVIARHRKQQHPHICTLEHKPLHLPPLHSCWRRSLGSIRLQEVADKRHVSIDCEFTIVHTSYNINSNSHMLSRNIFLYLAYVINWRRLDELDKANACSFTTSRKLPVVRNAATTFTWCM